MGYKKLMSPEYRLLLQEAELSSGFYIRYVSSMDARCDTCRLALEQETAEVLDGYDIGDCAIEMGSEEDFDLLIEGEGQWQKNRTEILILDGMQQLYRTSVRNTFLSCHPQEAVRYILTLSGVEKFEMSEAVYPVKDTFSVDAQNAVEALKELNAAWGIDVKFFWWGDTFYWGTRPEQEDVYELDDSNVLKLEKEGELWRAYVIGIPWLHHSQYILMNHTSLIAVCEVERCVIQSDAGSGTEMYIVFREVEDVG